uniref:Uncharacterized protein n=1 Tax=Myxococcus fulvus TaxID=33 RepID=A0A3S7V0K0_MYXFU|nr:hypothetical protein [Myxococcus fulvus]
MMPRRHLPLLLTLVLLGSLLGFFALCDSVDAVSYLLSWNAVILCLGLGLGAYGSRSAPRGFRMGLLVAFVGGVVGIRLTEWNSRKPFLRDFSLLRIGMTRGEVEAVMGRYIEGTGWPANPYVQPEAPHGMGSEHARDAGRGPGGALELKDSVVYRHTHQGWGDSDWGIVRFEAGRVAELSFSPD